MPRDVYEPPPPRVTPMVSRRAFLGLARTGIDYDGATAQIRARPAVQVGILQPPSKLSGSEEDAEKARRFIEEARKMIVTGAGAPDAE